MQIPATHIRRLKSALRGTGTATVTLEVTEAGSTKFVGLARDGKERTTSGNIAADGTLSLSKEAAERKAAQAERKAADHAEPEATTED